MPGRQSQRDRASRVWENTTSHRARVLRARNQAEPVVRLAAPSRRDEGSYALEGSCPRERERERDASATLTRPITDAPAAHGLSTALIPNENTRSTTLSLVATRSLSQGPRQKPAWCRPRGPTPTRPYVPRHPKRVPRQTHLIHKVSLLSRRVHAIAELLAASLVHQLDQFILALLCPDGLRVWRGCVLRRGCGRSWARVPTSGTHRHKMASLADHRKHETRLSKRILANAPGGNRTRGLRFERPLLFGSPKRTVDH